MEKFFKLKENKTTVSTEVMAGVTTFFAMSYILFVNPTILSAAGMPFQAVFLATIIASVIGTLIMGLFANVPYAQAPGMGLNAFFTFTVVFGLGYTWQQALAMVFICGLINIFITVTRIRKMIIHAIPESMQHAIGGGIGIFVAYVGIKNANLLNFSADTAAVTGSVVDGETIVSANFNGGIVPALANFNNAPVLLAVIGLVVTTLLVVKNVRGAIIFGILGTTIIGILMGVVDLSAIDWHGNSLGSSISELGITFGAAFGSEGMGSLFSDSAKIPQVIMTILAFSLSDVFDTRCRSHFCRGHRRDLKYNDLCGISSWHRCWWTHGLDFRCGGSTLCDQQYLFSTDLNRSRTSDSTGVDLGWGNDDGFFCGHQVD
jgi:AGZA family xanthine/uracil permease-like MFS transporter